MPQPFIGEIRLFAGNFAPLGWLFCSGQLLPISENDALFVLLGTRYGGDGESTFALPDLRGRVPRHYGSLAGSDLILGENGGVESVTLTQQQIPSHTHALLAVNSVANLPAPTGAFLARSSRALIYFADTNTNVSMNAAAIGPVGGSQPHENMMPFLGINYIISLFGTFPSAT